MRDGLDLSRGRHSARKRRRQLAVLGAVLLLTAAGFGLREQLGPVWAVLAQVPARADALLAEHFVPGYTRRLQSLRRRNAALHAAVAAAAPLETENAALRALLGSSLRPGTGSWEPARVLARSPEGSLTLAGQYDPGTPVLDEEGCFIGMVDAADTTGSRVDPAGQGRGAAAVLAGDCCGVLLRKGGTLLLTGLPRHSGLEAGTVVTTADGLWVGTLAETPTADATGLTGQAPLQDTGSTAGAVFFLPAGAQGA